MRPWQRLFALVAVLALIVGLAANGAGAGAMSDEMANTMATADSSASCDDGDCTAHEMSAAACYAVCSGPMAVLAGSTWTDFAAERGRNFWAAPARSGFNSPPDPSPPRPAVLI